MEDNRTGDPKIWIDGDACPRPVKELVFKASKRLGLEVVLVADRPVGVPSTGLIKTVIVPKQMDSADQHIVDHLEHDDLVITADLPLAAEVVARDGVALNPRGELYTEENVRERLSMRDFMMSLRDAGENLGGPPPYSKKDKEKFAAALEKYLTGMGCGRN